MVFLVQLINLHPFEIAARDDAPDPSAFDDRKMTEAAIVLISRSASIARLSGVIVIGLRVIAYTSVVTPAFLPSASVRTEPSVGHGASLSAGFGSLKIGCRERYLSCLTHLWPHGICPASNFLPLMKENPL